MAVEDWTELLLSAARTTAEHVTVAVKTNFGPELTLYRGRADGAGVGSLLGLKAALIVRSEDGRTLTTLGSPPPTDLVRAAVLWSCVGLVGYLLLRGAVRR